MREGERAVLHVPSSKGYGASAQGSKGGAWYIPANSNLHFDIEILVRLYWQGVKVTFLPTQVIYPENGVSHFRALHDNVGISWLHTRLFFGMLLRSPKLLWRKVAG